jgi:hypothetical protein
MKFGCHEGTKYVDNEREIDKHYNVVVSYDKNYYVQINFE